MLKSDGEGRVDNLATSLTKKERDLFSKYGHYWCHVPSSLISKAQRRPKDLFAVRIIHAVLSLLLKL